MESDQPTQDANTEGNVTAVIDAPEQTEAEHVKSVAVCGGRGTITASLK